MLRVSFHGVKASALCLRLAFIYFLASRGPAIAAAFKESAVCSPQLAHVHSPGCPDTSSQGFDKGTPGRARRWVQRPRESSNAPDCTLRCSVLRRRGQMGSCAAKAVVCALGLTRQGRGNPELPGSGSNEGRSAFSLLLPRLGHMCSEITGDAASSPHHHAGGWCDPALDYPQPIGHGATISEPWVHAVRPCPF